MKKIRTFIEPLLRRGRAVARYIKEGVVLTQIRGNMLRTFLSLIGVSIGIFTIVSILTAVDALKESVRKGFEEVGNNLIMVSKWPLAEEDDDGNQSFDFSESREYRWWDYIKRPAVTMEDFSYLKENSQKSKAVVFETTLSTTVKSGRSTLSDCEIFCVTESFEEMAKLEITDGRDILGEEFLAGKPVALLGANVAQNLFEGESPIGAHIKVSGAEVVVVGVLSATGHSLLNIVQTDDKVILPITFYRRFLNTRRCDGQIFLQPKEGVTIEEAESEAFSLLKRWRHIRPGQKNNFSVSSLSLLSSAIEQVMELINKVGWAIAIFSLLIGGVGIANIMFVSVKERTNITGIQMALGAKRYLIMIQFLTEAVILALSGAVIGVALVALILWAVPIFSEYGIHMALTNTLIGVIVASVIGILSGLLPAYRASRLNPIEAINSK